MLLSSHDLITSSPHHLIISSQFRDGSSEKMQKMCALAPLRESEQIRAPSWIFLQKLDFSSTYWVCEEVFFLLLLLLLLPLLLLLLPLLFQSLGVGPGLSLCVSLSRGLCRGLSLGLGVSIENPNLGKKFQFLLE